MYDLIFLAVFIIAMIIIVKFLKKQDEENTEELRKIARNMGFVYTDKIDTEFLEPLRRFELFSKRRREEVRHLITGRKRYTYNKIFEYTYTQRTRDKDSSYDYSVICIIEPSANFPKFILKTETFLHRIGAVIGFQDIDFDEDPEFSKKFVLQGRDVQAIKNLFDPLLRKKLYDLKHFTIEADKDTMLIYQFYQEIRYDRLPEFHSTSLEIFEAFFSASARL